MTTPDASMSDSGLPEGFPFTDSLDNQTLEDANFHETHLQNAQELHSQALEQGISEEPWGIDNLESPHGQEFPEQPSDSAPDQPPDLPISQLEGLEGWNEAMTEEPPTGLTPETSGLDGLAPDHTTAGLELGNPLDSASSIPVHSDPSINPELLTNNLPQSEVMESAQSCLSNNPYITVSQSGFINYHAKFQHVARWVGTVHGHSFENRNGRDLGYVQDGTVYDHWDRIIGCVHGGKIFNRKGIQIGTADNDIEGAAYLFFIVKGGVQ